MNRWKCITDHASGIRLPDCSKLAINRKKWQWCQNLPTWHYRHVFWCYRFSLVKFKFWCKFLNVITGSGVSLWCLKRFYEGLKTKRTPQIGYTPVWVLPNIWRLGRVKDTKSTTNGANEKLMKAAKCQGCSFYRFWIIKGKPAGSKKYATHPN